MAKMTQPASKAARVSRYDLEGPTYYNLTKMNRKDPAIIAGPVITDLTNMKIRSWGLEPRQGYAKHNTTAIQDSAVDEGLWIFPFDKGFGATPRYLMAVSVDGRIFYSTTVPPTASDFTELKDLAAELSEVSAVSVAGRFIIATGGVSPPLVWYGLETDPLSVTMDCDDEHLDLWDLTEIVTDGQSGTSIDIGGRGASEPLYIATFAPINKISVTMGTNKNAETVTITVKHLGVSGYSADILTADGTLSGGATLAQNGDITLDAHTPTVETDAWAPYGGYVYKIDFSGDLSADTDIALITVYSTVNEVISQESTGWDLPEFVMHDNTEYTREVTDYVELDDEGSVSYIPFSQWDSDGTRYNSDRVIVASYNKFKAVKFTISKNYVLDGNGTLDVEVSSIEDHGYVNATNIVDKTSVLSKSGTIRFSANKWTRASSNADLPMYRAAFDVGDATPDTNESRITEIRIKPSYGEFERWKYVSRWGNRAVFFNRDGAENQVVISEENRPESIVGPDSQILPVGPRQPILAGVPFYHEFWMASEDKVYLLWNTTPPFGVREYGGAPEGVVAPASAKSLELPDGSFIVIRQGRNGVYLFDGKGDRLIGVKEWGPFFDQNATGCINATYIDKSRAWISRDSEGVYYNLAITTGSNTKHDTVLVYNALTDTAWHYNYADDLHSGCSVIGSDGKRYEYLGGYGHAYKVSGTADIAANITHDVTLGSLFFPDGYEHEVPYLFVCGKPESAANNVVVSTFENGATSDSEAITFDSQGTAEYFIEDVHVAVDDAESVKFKLAAAAGKKLTLYSVAARHQRKRENV